MRRVLGSRFFARKATAVAPDLIGKYLVVRRGGKIAAYMITETEAYDGPHDRASHASRGRTPRTEVMFGPPGRWYVYFVYGMHEMLNVVCGPKEYPAAVLIRSAGGIEGPGRLTKALGITRGINRKHASRPTGVWIEERGVALPRGAIQRSPRVGVAYAGHWALRPWRYRVACCGARER